MVPRGTSTHHFLCVPFAVARVSSCLKVILCVVPRHTCNSCVCHDDGCVSSTHVPCTRDDTLPDVSKPSSRTCAQSRGSGQAQPFLLHHEAGSDEGGAAHCKQQSFLFVAHRVPRRSRNGWNRDSNALEFQPELKKDTTDPGGWIVHERPHGLWFMCPTCGRRVQETWRMRVVGTFFLPHVARGACEVVGWTTAIHVPTQRTSLGTTTSISTARIAFGILAVSRRRLRSNIMKEDAFQLQSRLRTRPLVQPRHAYAIRA